MREQPVSDTSLSRTTEELELAHARYEYLRTLNPQQFKSLYERNIKGEGRFDDLVDADRQQKKVAA
jgi:hypothetical protein